MQKKKKVKVEEQNHDYNHFMNDGDSNKVNFII